MYLREPCCCRREASEVGYFSGDPQVAARKRVLQHKGIPLHQQLVDIDCHGLLRGLGIRLDDCQIHLKGLLQRYAAETVRAEDVEIDLSVHPQPQLMRVLPQPHTAIAPPGLHRLETRAARALLHGLLRHFWLMELQDHVAQTVVSGNHWANLQVLLHDLLHDLRMAHPTPAFFKVGPILDIQRAVFRWLATTKNDADWALPVHGRHIAMAWGAGLAVRPVQ
mmetsp:Transcript_147/g.346  ORF Transcript_147/g.346 Transcript_147/m.346 type:complete len:222 (+) Transcript_147:546-1211(+)